jgi:hypothetical protein
VGHARVLIGTGRVIAKLRRRRVEICCLHFVRIAHTGETVVDAAREGGVETYGEGYDWTQAGKRHLGGTIQTHSPCFIDECTRWWVSS